MSDIDAIYKSAKAILWVEDPDTRAWLEALWIGLAPTIRVIVAGGHRNVRAACEQARNDGNRHVFGLMDCDFDKSNRDRWSGLATSEVVYRLDVHEFENLLLDSVALVSCRLNTGKRAQQDVENRLISSASNRAWWVACSRFLSETSQAATAGYPGTPGTIASQSDAEQHVLSTDWFRTVAADCPNLATGAAISSGLVAAYQKATQALADGTWRSSFPGKEIFREIAAYVQPGAVGAAGRIDLIKAVAAWQLAHAVPAQANELRTCILARV